MLHWVSVLIKWDSVLVKWHSIQVEWDSVRDWLVLGDCCPPWGIWRVRGPAIIVPALKIKRWAAGGHFVEERG